MLIGQIPAPQLVRRLRDEGIRLKTGAFTVRLRIAWRSVAHEFLEMYGHYPVLEVPGVDDVRLRVGPRSWLHGLYQSEVFTVADGLSIINPVPFERAFTALESGLNWGVMRSAGAPIIMHAAVLERRGLALLMPAPSGSGKSTLSAALALRGWRLLSDEMAVFPFDEFVVAPNPRPVSLKNAAIEVIRAFEPATVISRTYSGTFKGDVAYMRAPDEAVAKIDESAPPGIVLVPAFRAGAATRLSELGRTEAFKWMLESTVNYSSMLELGFELLARIADECGLYRLEYSDLDEAVDLLDKLSEEHAPPDRY